MLNINLKAIIFEEKAALACESELSAFISEAKKYVSEICIDLEGEKVPSGLEKYFDRVGSFDYRTMHEEIRMPVFHCVVFAVSEDYIKKAKSWGYKVVKIGEGSDASLLATVSSLSEISVRNFLECGKIRPYEVNENEFTETDVDASDIKHLESVFALGNGYLGFRGTYDESDESLPEESGMYINGIFEKTPFRHLCRFKGYPDYEQYTVNLADFRITEVYVDGERAKTSALKNHRRTLDFVNGRINRSFIFEASSGKRVRVESIRIVNMLRPHSAEIRYSVTPINFSGEVKIVSRVIKTTDLAGKHPLSVTSEKLTDNGIEFLSTVEVTRQEVAFALYHSVAANDYTVNQKSEGNEYAYEITANVKENETVTVDKFAAFYASVDKVDDMSASSAAEAAENLKLGFDALASEQTEFWADHWRRADIKISGPEADQQAIRFSLFHLRQQVPSINEASIGATGLTGPNYSGKVFWDTEMYLMPYYNFTEPEICKQLLLYRKKILPRSIERAQQMGGVGALYAWSSINGEETSIIYEASTAEYHVNSDIAYAVWRYDRTTNDKEFIYENCAEMVFQTAKFMAHRGTFVDAYDGRFCINSVCGPDEYGCAVNNNCFTNFMVQFHLRYALQLYEEMKTAKPELLKKIADGMDLDGNELTLWKDAADKMYYRVNEKYGIYEQDDKFVYNDAVDMDMIPKNYDIRGMYHPLDLWRIQVIKQADVVLLQFIFGNRFTLEEKKRNFDYYEPKTNHGSSLSAAIHAIMANEIGYYEQAYDYFRCTAYMDIGDFKKNTAGGIHIACLGGVWMVVVNGFLGMRMYDEDGLEFNVRLPEEWNEIETKFAYKNAVMNIKASKKETVFTLLEGDGMSFRANGREISLTKEASEIKVEN